MGEGAASVEVCGAHTMWWRAKGDPRHVVWGAHGPPPTLLWTSCRVRENRDLSFCFVQFQEYFLCNYSETKKAENRQLALWHLVNRLIPKNAIKCYKVQVKHVAIGII